FSKLAALATGEYFSWLQDDDLVHRDFARRAVDALSESEDIGLYLCWAVYTPSPVSIHRWRTIHGPLIPVEWVRGERRVIDGIVRAPLGLCESVAIPPAIAFRIATVRRAVVHVLGDCDLVNEYIVIAVAGAQGRVAIDPWVGAIHTHHDKQMNLM